MLENLTVYFLTLREIFKREKYIQLSPRYAGKAFNKFSTGFRNGKNIFST